MDNIKRINNKTPEQILTELSVFVKTTDKTYQGFDYRKVEDFYERLWTVCGKENVVINMPSSATPVYTSLPTGQTLCSVYMEVSILYDDGEVWRTAGSWGESEIIYSDKGNRYEGLGNVIDTASAKALKLALKKLDIFGVYSYKESGSKASSKNKKEDKASKPASVGTNRKSGTFRLKGTESIAVVRKDNNTGLPVYTWKCQNEGGAFNVVFYPNKYSNVGDWMDRLVLATKDKPDILVDIVCQELGEKDGIPQLMFESRVS